MTRSGRPLVSCRTAPWHVEPLEAVVAELEPGRALVDSRYWLSWNALWEVCSSSRSMLGCCAQHSHFAVWTRVRGGSKPEAEVLLAWARCMTKANWSGLAVAMIRIPGHAVDR